jgi:cobalt/nickel transport system permease protein
MHIPDGFLDPKITGGLMAAGAGLVAMAYSKVKAKVTVLSMSLAGSAAGNITKKIGGGIRILSADGGEYLSKLTVIAALIFAAQMFNFPVTNGTSGHLLGAVLATLFLGQWGGIVAITIVLLVQSLFFADGGFLALGANIINLAGFGCLMSWHIHRFIKKFIKNSNLAIFITAWFSVAGAAGLCSVELAVSGTYSFFDTFKAMLGVHALIGLGEGLITVVLVNYISRILKWSMYSEEK